MTVATSESGRMPMGNEGRAISMLRAGRSRIKGSETAMAFSRLVESHFHDPTTKIGKEVTCLNQILARAVQGRCSNKNINLIDLGTGNGQKAAGIIQFLIDDGAQSIHYYPIDMNGLLSKHAILRILFARRERLSEEDVLSLFGGNVEPGMVEFVADRMIPLDELVALNGCGNAQLSHLELDNVTVPNRGLEIDFIRDTGDVPMVVRGLAWYRLGVSVYCLLGRTFGNYSFDKRIQFLYNLQKRMLPGDLLLLDAGLRPAEDSCLGVLDRRIEKLEKDYLVGERFLRFEADSEGSNYNVEYDRSSRRVRSWFERPDKSIQEIGSSYLFRVQELLDLIVDSGLELCCSETSMRSSGPSREREGSECVAVLARKPLESKP